MKNSLVVHHDNIISKNLFVESIHFNFLNGDIDKYIHSKIIPQLVKNNFDILYIKDSLSSNYLDFYGLRLAYHIRLSPELKEKSFVPIVMISDLDVYLLNKLTPMANIFFTKNIFIASNTKKSIVHHNELKFSNLSEQEYESDFLNKIQIEAPKESHHDISNEWSIYQWSEFLKIKDSEVINENKEKISSMLYFKYLLAKTKIVEPKKGSISFVPQPPQRDGKILYIDDEWNKGWGDIFKRHFSKNKNIEFDIFEHDFRDYNKFSIISSIKNKCKNCDPDLVILDLRLVEKDHEIDRKLEQFTGIEITKAIKKINPAIQILMFTATSQSLILEKLYERAILGYIKKEHPKDNIAVKDSFDKLKILVDKGLEKKYLKKIWDIQEQISIDNSKIQLEIKSIFEILNSEMENRFIYAMFAIFKCIELVNDIYIIDGYKKATWKDTNQSFSDNSSKNKITLILNERLKLREDSIHESITNIIKVRNNTIHPKQGRVEKIDKDNILKWFEMLQEILERVENDQSNP